MYSIYNIKYIFFWFIYYDIKNKYSTYDIFFFIYILFAYALTIYLKEDFQKKKKKKKKIVNELFKLSPCQIFLFLAFKGSSIFFFFPPLSIKR